MYKYYVSCEYCEQWPCYDGDICKGENSSAKPTPPSHLTIDRQRAILSGLVRRHEQNILIEKEHLAEAKKALKKWERNLKKYGDGYYEQKGSANHS